MTTSPPPDNVAPEVHHYLRHPASGETTLYLVRHGRTDGNLRGLLHGVTDVPLDQFGVRQAISIAERLRLEVTPDVLLTSPLARALTTARIIGERLGLQPEIVPELTEMDFGSLEGSTVERIAADHPDLARRLLDGDDEDLAWPDGESRRGFHNRVLAAFQAILADYAAHRVVVVAHGGVIGSFLAQIQGRSPNDPAIYDLMNCSLTHLHVTPAHTVLHCRNDVVHLDGLAETDDRAGDAAESLG